MKRRTLYELFIGLLALMLSIMLILDLMYKLPLMVIESFYYINFIVSLLFLCDYIVRLSISRRKINFIFNNGIDFLSGLPFMVIGNLIYKFNLFNFIDLKVKLEIVKVILLVILITKFKNKIKETVRVNKFNYLLIITTIIIVLGAVIIALLENMTFGDAIWWSFVTFTTVGYGDVLLTTTLGRLVAILLMIFGIGFIGITTSTIAAYIVNKDIIRDRKRNFRDETLEFIKYKIDNIDSISDEELDSIYKTLRVLRENKKG